MLKNFLNYSIGFLHEFDASVFKDVQREKHGKRQKLFTNKCSVVNCFLSSVD